MLYLYLMGAMHTGYVTILPNRWYACIQKTVLLLLAFVCCISLFAQIPPIGRWREHLNYQQAMQVIKGDKLYCATTSAVFSVDDKNEMERYNKVTGLNDIGVNAIGWDAQTGQLVIAYRSSNLDIVHQNKVRNIGDIRRSTITGNKTIYHIYCSNGLAYLCSGLGVIVADLARYEIRDTWFIGNNGARVKVNGLTSDASFFYAATDEGLKRAAVNATDLADFRNWSLISGSNGLPAGGFNHIITSNNKVIARKNDSLFVRNGNNWNFLYADTAWPLVSMTGSENKLLLCQRNSSGNARVLVLNTDGIVEKTVVQNGIISLPRSAILDKTAVWTADQFGGLSKFMTAFERFIPNGPPGPALGEMVIKNNMLYAAAGTVNEAWNYQFNRDGIFQFSDDEWSYRGYFNRPVLDSVLDFITLAIDPADESLWAGSYGGGLVHFSGQQIRILKQNSGLQAAIGDAGSYRVSGLAFDHNRNLWISNYGAAQNLQVRKADSTWKSFSIPFAHLENAVGQLLVDDLNQLWIQSPKGNGLFCYQYGQSIDNTGDDRWKHYRQGIGNGNLPGNNVLCLLKDKDGFIWVGTSQGIGIIQCPENVFSAQSCEALLPIIQQDRFAGLLFKDEMVQCMAVDGANRKWIGTKNGVWLISPNGDKIIYRFTEENSPLLGNDVKRIAVDPGTGEVFMATINGICSFRSTATEGAEMNREVLVYPNPVPPGYQGTIAIRGLVANALVKITELNGRLVYQTRALGGQAIWNGRTYTGNKAASGLYLVIVRDDTGAEKVVTKLVITSGR